MSLGVLSRAVLYKRSTFQRNLRTKTNQENKLKWKGTAPVHTSQRTQPISIWNTLWIMLMRKITDIYNDNQMRNINKQCGKMNSLGFLGFLLFCWICIRLQFNAIRLLMFNGGNCFYSQPGWGYFEIISFWMPNEKKIQTLNALTDYKLLTPTTHAKYTKTHIHVKIVSNKQTQYPDLWLVFPRC
jgi:hypothetical protein